MTTANPRGSAVNGEHVSPAVVAGGVALPSGAGALNLSFALASPFVALLRLDAVDSALQA